jgi:hypothetical protein
MSLEINSFIFFISLLFLIFKRPKIGSYYNPIFSYWILYFFFPTLLGSVISSPKALNPWISISTTSIYILALYFSPSIRMRKGIRLLKITVTSLIIYFTLFLLPNIIDFYNIDISRINSFSERNSAIASMPLAVLSRSLASLQIGFLAISSGLLLKISFITIVISGLLEFINFNYLSSKMFLVAFLFQFLTYIYLRKIILESNRTDTSPSLFIINSKVLSPFEILVNQLKTTKINSKLLIYFLLFFILILISISLLQRLDFNVSLILDRIVMNFDTLIYLSDIIERDLLSVSESGFITIFSVWFKPIASILNLPIEYSYLSVVQYIFSKWSGSYWHSSSLGNSNLVAESIVSSGLYLGVVTSPILMWLLLKFLQRGIINFSVNSLLVLFPLTLYVNSYLFFASAQEYVMIIYVYATLFFLFRLITRVRLKSRTVSNLNSTG